MLPAAAARAAGPHRERPRLCAPDRVPRTVRPCRGPREDIHV